MLSGTKDSSNNKKLTLPPQSSGYLGRLQFGSVRLSSIQFASFGSVYFIGAGPPHDWYASLDSDHLADVTPTIVPFHVTVALCSSLLRVTFGLCGLSNSESLNIFIMSHAAKYSPSSLPLLSLYEQDFALLFHLQLPTDVVSHVR